MVADSSDLAAFRDIEDSSLLVRTRLHHRPSYTPIIHLSDVFWRKRWALLSLDGSFYRCGGFWRMETQKKRAFCEAAPIGLALYGRETDRHLRSACM